jgi:putative flippase GtrA
MRNRFIRFNAVGVLGFALQLAVLWGLVRGGVHYLAATAIAVEAAVLHNYLWHERWTWRERDVHGWARLRRLGGFHLLNGIVSLLGNLALMRLLVGVWQMPPLPANLVAVITCSLINFALSDRLVFTVRRSSRLPLPSEASVPRT